MYLVADLTLVFHRRSSTTAVWGAWAELLWPAVQREPDLSREDAPGQLGEPTVIITDAGSYSDQLFGVFRLLGYQFSPRLADVGEPVCGASIAALTMAQ